MNSLYEEIVPELTKMLAHLDAWLGRAVEHAQSGSLDPAVLLAARLAPDMYPLMRQVQTACDHAKFAAARATGKDAPKHADGAQTFDELRARIADVRAYLGTFTAADFDGAEARVIPLRHAAGKAVLAPVYVRELSLPNFYFHTCMTYAILRHSGVVLGKSDYLGVPTATRDL